MKKGQTTKEKIDELERLIQKKADDYRKKKAKGKQNKQAPTERKLKVA